MSGGWDGNPATLPYLQVGVKIPNGAAFRQVPRGTPAAALVKKLLGGSSRNLSSAEWAQVQALMPGPAASTPAAPSRAASSSGGGAGAGFSGGMSGKPAVMMSELRRRLDKLETHKVAEDPLMASARKNASKALRLIACPDELAKQGVKEMPLYPSDSTSARFPMVSSLTTSANLDNYNTLVEAPGQTLFCLQNITTGTFPVPTNGSLVALNMGSSDFCWNLSEFGSPTLAGQTRRLVPRFHFGYLATCASLQPTAPAVVQYSPPPSGAYGIFYPVTDGAGNYYLAPSQAQATNVVVIGTCTTAATSSVSSTTFPITGMFTLGAIGVAMSVIPLFPTSGAAVRSLLMAEGAFGSRLGPDMSFTPSTVLASNIRIQSLASALQNKVSVVSYAVPGGREGVYGAPQTFRGVGGQPVTPSLSLLAAKSRQHSMGLMNPDNGAWYAVNIAARISEMREGEACVINDLSFIGNNSDSGNTVLAVATVQGDAVGSTVPTNPPEAGWDDNFVFSISFLTTGIATGTSSSIPVQLEAYSWLEFHIASELGLPVRYATYFSEMKAWLQVISTYPVLACADSFKDYFAAAWSKTKDFGRDLTRRLMKNGKTMLRDAFVEALLAAL